MKKLFITLILICSLISQSLGGQLEFNAAYNFLQVTNHTMVVEGGDSFEVAQYANRGDILIFAYLINMNPDWDVEVRCGARSGGSNLETLQQRGPEIFFPHFYASMGTTNVKFLEYVSSNGGTTSNTSYAYIQEELLYPTTVRDQAGNITNDWTQSTNLYQKAIIGDIAYPSADGGASGVVPRNDGGSNAAYQASVPFVDSWHRMVNVTTNVYPLYPAYWFPNGHPANELQFLWGLVRLLDLGAETNIYTGIVNYGNGTVVSASHCSISSVVKTGNDIQFNLLLSRMSFGYDVGDNWSTNNVLDAFNLWPSMTNAFFEVLQFNGLQDGYYKLNIDGEDVDSGVASKFRNGYNMWRLYAGAIYRQKQEVNRHLRIMRNINPTNASDRFITSSNTLEEAYGSYASARWPTNTLGVNYYCNLMQDREAELRAYSLANLHTAAQQTNHIIKLIKIGDVEIKGKSVVLRGKNVIVR